MNTSRVDGHTSQAFDADMNEIVNKVLDMGSLVTHQVEKAIYAFIHTDADMARAVISKDDEVNHLEVKIDEHCVQVLVRRQPTAGDLRAVIAAIKTIKDLERIGDQAKRIARSAIKAAEAGAEADRAFPEFEMMGTRVVRMLQDAMTAFRNHDAQEALQVALQDKAIDSDYESILRQNMTYMMEDPRNITRIVEMTWVGRAIERIGDHARNVCEYTIYFVKGRDVRHIDDAQIEAIVQGR
ncbi:phosphate signaling complex protein PhoU [Nitrincola tapanii]|uniref:Phosphate-specific transport system accessory protein PhoU n=1 Tax=Nitrincola tapanii TaxID=1708751 RepID=A0A5A9W2E0_9GAMM|nr:phosphate signaling complex protein PhoU [Nitrincola tapanii]KAA0873721.1 phosphate signaling complex protein PhoU [Nitrincola tapanii]